MKIRYTHPDDIKPYLVLGYGNIDYIDIYYRDSLNIIRNIKSGTFSDTDSRAFLATEYIFQLPSLKKSPKEIYVRLKAVNTLIVPLKIVDGITLAKALFNKYIWQILYLGITFSVFLFNLFMLFSTRDNLYSLYMIRIFFLFYLYVIAYLNGYSNFFPNAVNQFILVHAQALAAIGFIATILFNNLFLSVKEYMPRSLKWFNGLLFLWVLILIFSFWDTRVYTNSFAHILVFITSAFILINSIRIIRKMPVKKNPFIVCYALGWMPVSLVTIYVVLALVNLVPLEGYTFQIVALAGVLEGILISLALLGDNIRILNKGKIDAEQEALNLIKERNVYLEQKIGERTEEIQQVNERLKESNGFKDKLFSIIAHDMRSPLSSLKGVLQLADRDLLKPEDISRLLTRVRLNTEQVQKTMDNLLNWSISQMNLQQYQPEVICIEEFLVDHLSIYEILAWNKEILTSISCSKDVYVLADRNQLSLIVRNLIDNAVKFTPKGGVINMGVKYRDGNALLYVGNSGEAIKTETIAKILGTNTNLGTSYGTAQEKGTGLGLQLCKEYIRNLNSELMIEGFDEEISTVFSFYLILQDVNNLKKEK
jgi:signal transduction histidine kinase